MTLRKNFDHLNDPLADALGVVGEWWTPLVITSIAGGSHRFEEIQNGLGIARNILTDRLNTLVAHEVVEKRQYSTKPKRFEYHLTKKGEAVLPAFELLAAWGAKWVTPYKHR
jgi:DNA-binding HxlR family transcriptional regulator